MNLGPSDVAILRVLRRSAEPLSGRQIADIVGVAPNTANKLLKVLQDQGLVSSNKMGRATLWSTTADVGILDGLGPATHERVALVVTAVDTEFTEVRNLLVNGQWDRVGGQRLWRGELFGAGIDWTIYLAQAGMGNATSAALVGLAAGGLKANVVSFVGVAGGLKPGDQCHGDVVVASRIHNPYVGKQVDVGGDSVLLGRDKTYPVSPAMLRMVSASISDSAWTPVKRNSSYNARHPHAYVAPIVAVEAVQTDRSGPLNMAIQSRFQDAAALDMESHGLAAGADIHELPMLVIRGLSDFVGDKNEAGNDDRQPDAAGNAARFLSHVLTFADPEDFHRVAGGIAGDPPERGPSGRPLVSLPGGIEVWVDRLRRRAPERAASALDAIRVMRDSGTSAATWLSKALHRPPVWLREDDSGDGWALMANLANVAGSTVSWRAFEFAADAALLTGDKDAHSYFKITAAIQRLRNEDDVSEDDAEATRLLALAALDDLPPAVLQSGGEPLVMFYKSALDPNAELLVTKKCAERVLAALSLNDSSGVMKQPAKLPSHWRLDEELQAMVASSVLQQVARMMLTPGVADEFGVGTGLGSRNARGNPVVRDLADDALLVAQWAVELRPRSEGAQLTQAQTMLAVLVGMTGRSRVDIDFEVSKRARQVEVGAMEIRDVFADWNGTTGGALAVAARARSMQGDTGGALRMLLPAPEGLATQEEARHPDVVRLAAFFAMALGRDELAVELTDLVRNRAEAELMKASVFAATAGMGTEATKAFFDALENSDGQIYQQFQVLTALSKRYHQLSVDERAAVDRHIDGIEEADAELADVLRARVALAVGNPELALEHVRGLAPHELALMTRADALVELGRGAEAARILFDEGISRGDDQLTWSALELAVNQELHDFAREVARTVLSGEVSDGMRLRVVQALRRVEREAQQWTTVLQLTEQLVEELGSNGLPVPESEYWQMAEALYFLGRFQGCVQILLDVPSPQGMLSSVTFNERQKVMLFLSALQRGLDEQRSSDRQTGGLELGGDVFALFMRAASEWAHDEQIAAFAVTIAMTAPNANLTEAQVLRIREYSERYFESHGGEDALIQQISVEDDNLDSLVEYLSRSDTRTKALAEVSQMVRANRLPLAALTELAGRTYAESLIRIDMGCIIAVDDDGGAGVEAASAALNGRVVVDTSALAVGSLTGFALRKLIAKFDTVVLPEPLRHDLERARSSLAMKSTGTIGWDPKRKRPYMTETSEEDAEVWAEAANDLWDHVQLLRTDQAAPTDKDHAWLSPINIAVESKLPLWVDDVPMRQLARSMGVAAFGTLDLVAAFADSDTVAAITRTLRENRVVDLPIVEPWPVMANAAEWDPSSPFASAISRPFAWRDPSEAFDQYRVMIGRLAVADPGLIATWAHLAGSGLAMSIPVSRRPRSVAALLASTIFAKDPFFSAPHMARRILTQNEVPDGAGQVTQLVFGVAEDLREHHFADAEILGALVSTISDVLTKTLGPEPTSRLMADLVDLLDDPLGHAVFAAYLEAVDV